MEDRIVQQVFVDSRDRDLSKFPSSSSYRVRLPNTYKNVIAARLLAIVLPTTYYVFCEAHENITFSATVGGVTATVTIPQGNYTTATMVEQVQTSLETAFPSNTFATALNDDMSMTIECNALMSVDPSSSLAVALGFGTAQSPALILRGAAIINVNPITYMLLDIRELTSIDEGAIGGKQIGKGAFAYIQIPATTYSFIFRDVDMAPPPVEQRPMIPKLETLTVSFRSHEGYTFDFRGAEHSFVIELTLKRPMDKPLKIRDAPTTIQVFQTAPKVDAPADNNPKQQTKIRVFSAQTAIIVGALAIVAWLFVMKTPKNK
jgi:hypothetical protein